MQVTTTLTLDPKTQQLLNQFGEVLRPPVIAAMDATAQAWESETALHTPVDQGILRASVYGRVVDLWPVVEAHAGSPLVYAAPIEYGSRPHWPPRAPIEAWVQRQLGVTGKEVARVAFLVARAISRRGTPAYHMFEIGRRRAVDLAPRLLAAAVERFTRTWSDR